MVAACARPEPWTLRVLAAGDVGAKTEVCACAIERLGGLDRRVEMVLERRTAATVVLDAGDVFFPDVAGDEEALPAARRHADALLEMGAAAMAVGDRDLALGLPALRHLGARAQVALVSANLVHAESATAAFPSFVVVERAGRKIGVVGASPPEAVRPGLRVLPPKEAVAKAARAARAAGAEAVIGLFHLGRAASRAVVQALPEGQIDLVLVAGDEEPGGVELLQGRKTALLPLGSEGKYLAEVELRVGGRPLLDQGALARDEAQLVALDARLSEGPDPDARARLEARRSDLESSLVSLRSAPHDPLSARLVPVREPAPEERGPR